MSKIDLARKTGRKAKYPDLKSDASEVEVKKQDMNELRDCVQFRHSVNCDDVAFMLSEYDKLRAELTKLRQAYEDGEKYCQAVEADLATCVSALKYIVNRGYTGAEYVAREALAKVGK